MKKHSEDKKDGTKKRGKAATKARRLPASSTTAPESLIGERESELIPVIENYDASQLSQAKAHWFFGEWDALAELDIETLRNHPERDRLVLLVAAAQQQLGQHDLARKSVRLALEWGCSHQLVAQVLVAGVHNTLGRAAALAQKEARAIKHFNFSVEINGTSGGATDLVAHARSVREMAKLGLLPQAAALMGEAFAKASGRTERPEQTQARLKMLESEIELMRGSLILAAQRGQLYAGNSPDQLGRTPDRAATKTLRSELQRMTTSQLGQDLWVLEKTGYKRNGFFVEFGATDGVLLSNTYLLEKEFGWSGICAEPNPAFFDQLKKNRTCITTDACISGESGRDVEFILADEFGGIAEYAGSDMHADKRGAYSALGKTLYMTTISLHELLTKHNAPCEIDYLSIDTEGSEYDILKAFPFDQWRIRCITVEHNYSSYREPIRKLLEEFGYRRVEAEWDDWYYLDTN